MKPSSPSRAESEQDEPAFFGSEHSDKDAAETDAFAELSSLGDRDEDERPFSLIDTMRHWMRGFGKRDSLREALQEVVEEHEEDGEILNPESRNMLYNILQFGELAVEDVMIHRSDVVAVSELVKLEDLRTAIIAHGHTRMPVYSGDLDTIIGLIHSKDLIPYIGNETGFELALIIRPVFAVPPSMKIVDLLVRMRSTGTHMAIVVDEYGGTDGIVTMEDLFEKIVGDIQDEYDEEDRSNLVEWQASGKALVDAKIPLEALEEQLEMSLGSEEEEEADFDTLGGLMFNLFGHVPRKGERVTYKGLTLEVAAADARRIYKVRIYKGSHG